MNQHLTHGFADELVKLAITMPAQGLRRALRSKGLTHAAQAEQKATLRAGAANNIAVTQVKNMANLPKPPRFDK